MTVAEYAGAAEDLVATMVSDFGSIDAEWESGEPSPDRAEEYWEQRLEIREALLEGVKALVPPEPITGMHESAVDIFTRITAADRALAERVLASEALDGHWGWVDTPEGQAVEAILAEVYDFCRASQADFDATAQGAAFEDMPWVPSEMTETVSVAFGCPPSP